MVVLYNKYNVQARSLARKLANSLPNEAIPCSGVELEVLMEGKDIVIIRPSNCNEKSEEM